MSTKSNKEESQAEASQFNKSLKEIATNAATWFIPVVGLTYACGFLIVFTFFKNFGINTVEFIEAKYIHIGSLFMMACITIILPIRWIFVALKRWGKEKIEKDGKSNWDEVKDIIKELFSGGNFLKTVKKIFRRFFWSDWHVGGKNGIHATAPVIGSHIFMLLCFLLLMTFARPDFTQIHSTLVVLSLLLPLTIIFLAIPADRLDDWMETTNKDDFFYDKARIIWRIGNCILISFWTVAGISCLYWFFWSKHSFDDFLRWSISIYFGLPLLILAAVWLCLFFWQDKTENIPEKKLQQRLTVTRWLFYPIQWFLFLVQFWVFVRILSFDYLGTSVREIFVGKDWHLWRFLHSDLFLAFGNFYFNNKQDPNLFPKGGFIFILFILLMVFFGFRVFYRNKPADENNESKETGKENNESKALTIISTFCLLGVLFYFSIVSFARHIYPYIPAVKGGGDYTLSHPVQLTFDARFTNSIPPKVNEGLQTNRLSLILLDANSSFVFLADTNDADGPEKWRSSTKKPTVYEIRREAIISITHLNPTNSNN